MNSQEAVSRPRPGSDPRRRKLDHQACCARLASGVIETGTRMLSSTESASMAFAPMLKIAD